MYDIICKSLKIVGDYGSIAQLGEHLPYKQRVIGSSPIVSSTEGRATEYFGTRWLSLSLLAR